MSGPVVKRRRAGIEISRGRIDWTTALVWLGLFMIAGGTGASIVLWIGSILHAS